MTDMIDERPPRLPDKSAKRSEARERAAVTLERIAARIRADNGTLPFGELTVARTYEHAGGSYLVGETTTVTIHWKQRQ